ncbi:MAG: hypothetical protein CME80_11220 [Halomonas sp.]|nr:hypothetical protein [Halomonas sp.]MBF58272.1 hypothetical protein [Halomonas sp.]
MSEIKEKSGSFIVSFWSSIFQLLKYIALFPWVMKLWQKLLDVFNVNQKRRRDLSFLLVDTWTLGHLLLALLGLWLLNSESSALVSAGKWIATYGLLRTFELVVYQVNVLLFDEYRAKKLGRDYQIRGYRRMVILLVHNYFETVVWFACAHFLLMHWGWMELSANGLLGSLREALTLMVAFSFNGGSALNQMGQLILLFQAAVGILMTLVMLARFISILPTPDTMDELEQDKRRS